MQFLMYLLHLILLQYKNHKLSPLFAYTHHNMGSLLLLLLILPTQNNRSVKVLFTHDVWINTVFREGSHVKFSIHLHLVLYLPLNPTPHAVFLYITHNSVL